MFQAIIRIHGQEMEFSSYNEFILSVRSQAFKNQPFEVKVSIDSVESAWIGIEPRDLYLTYFADKGGKAKQIPKEIVGYGQNSDPLLSYGKFISAVKSTQNFADKNEVLTNETVKLIAFIISEAARFCVVEEAMNLVLQEEALPRDCRKWSDWQELLKGGWAAHANRIPVTLEETNIYKNNLFSEKQAALLKMKVQENDNALEDAINEEQVSLKYV